MKRKLLLFVLGFIFCNELVALSSNPYFSLMAGANIASPGKSQSVTLLAGDPGNYYTLDDMTQVTGLAGASVGEAWQVTPKFSWELGLSGYVNAQQKVHGEVWQFGDANFYNTDYEYYIQTSQLMLETKLVTTVHTAFHPYLDVGLGASFNEAEQYLETPASDTGVPMAPFHSHTTTSLAYLVGPGVNYLINNVWTVGLGYQFVSLGHARLGDTPAQDTTRHMYSGSLYDNRVLLTITHYIN